MSETPKQRIRRILDSLPIPREARDPIEQELERMTEEECGEYLEVFDDLLEESPGLIDELRKALEEMREEDP